ncbi:sensor histidine kinase [Sinosporangium siamense]|nr:ATP-binding protein [Sinosporangium siamense]
MRARQQEARGEDRRSAAAERGATERELNRATVRYAVYLRSAVVIPSAVFGVLSAPDGYVTATVAMAALAIGWCAFHLVWLRNRAHRPAWIVIVVDTTVLIATGAGHMAVADCDCGSGSWVMALFSITAITFPYEWPTRPLVGVGVALAGIAAYLAGGALARSGDWAAVTGPGVRVLMELTLSRLSFLLVRAQARAADRRVERLAARRREAAVAAARRASEREYLATLHDTASTTLLMVALGTGPVAHRARDDLDTLTRVPGSDKSRVDLASLLVTAAHHDLVRVEPRIGTLPPMPAGPALAIFHGVREALTNIDRHAGVAEATLRAEPGEHGGIVVELRDRGRGFDPRRVGPYRRGVSHSIVERMSSAGGRVLVDSAPGRGTTLRWTWPDDNRLGVSDVPDRVFGTPAPPNRLTGMSDLPDRLFGTSDLHIRDAIHE